MNYRKEEDKIGIPYGSRCNKIKKGILTMSFAKNDERLKNWIVK